MEDKSTAVIKWLSFTMVKCTKSPCITLMHTHTHTHTHWRTHARTHRHTHTHLWRDWWSELLVQFDDDPQTDQSILFILRLQQREHHTQCGLQEVTKTSQIIGYVQKITQEEVLQLTSKCRSLLHCTKSYKYNNALDRSIRLLLFIEMYTTSPEEAL